MLIVIKLVSLDIKTGQQNSSIENKNYMDTKTVLLKMGLRLWIRDLYKKEKCALLCKSRSKEINSEQSLLFQSIGQQSQRF